jgi:hypothetical protein
MIFSALTIRGFHDGLSMGKAQDERANGDGCEEAKSEYRNDRNSFIFVSKSDQEKLRFRRWVAYLNNLRDDMHSWH